MVSRPEGSGATVRFPRGSVTLSTPYNYHYKANRRAEFVPDRPGEYELKLTAKLVFADDLYPDKNVASASFRLRAEGEPQGGCSTGGAAGGLWMLGLLGLGLLRRRN